MLQFERRDISLQVCVMALGWLGFGANVCFRENRVRSCSAQKPRKHVDKQMFVMFCALGKHKTLQTFVYQHFGCILLYIILFILFSLVFGMLLWSYWVGQTIKLLTSTCNYGIVGATQPQNLLVLVCFSNPTLTQCRIGQTKHQNNL